MVRLGLVCSSGGSVALWGVRLLRAASLRVEGAMVTHAACGAEMVARRLGIEHRRIDYSDRDAFSRSAADWLISDCGVTWVSLFFSRLVSAPLFERVPCVNVHPSLLPAFPGLNALERTMDSGARFFGATAHLVDASIDGGPILAQTISPMRPGLDAVDVQRISFAQKLYLFLVVAERTSVAVDQWSVLRPEEFSGADSWAAPTLISSELASAFADFTSFQGIAWPRSDGRA